MFQSAREKCNKGRGERRQSEGQHEGGEEKREKKRREKREKSKKEKVEEIINDSLLLRMKNDSCQAVVYITRIHF